MNSKKTNIFWVCLVCFAVSAFASSTISFGGDVAIDSLSAIGVEAVLVPGVSARTSLLDAGIMAPQADSVLHVLEGVIGLDAFQPADRFYLWLDAEGSVVGVDFWGKNNFQCRVERDSLGGFFSRELSNAAKTKMPFHPEKGEKKERSSSLWDMAFYVVFLMLLLWLILRLRRILR